MAPSIRSVSDTGWNASAWFWKNSPYQHYQRNSDSILHNWYIIVALLIHYHCITVADGLSKWISGKTPGSIKSVRFWQKLMGPPSESVLEADELPRPASASVRFGRKLIGPPSASVLEADGVEKNLPSVVLHRPASASVPGRPSPSRDPWPKLQFGYYDMSTTISMQLPLVSFPSSNVIKIGISCTSWVRVDCTLKRIIRLWRYHQRNNIV